MGNRRLPFSCLLVALLPACSLGHNIDLPTRGEGDATGSPGPDGGLGDQGEETPGPGAGTGGANQSERTGVGCGDSGGAGGMLPTDAPEEGNGDLESTSRVPLLNDEPSYCSPPVVEETMDSEAADSGAPIIVK